MPFFPYMFAGDNPYYQHLLRYQVAAVAAQGRSGQFSGDDRAWQKFCI